MNEPHWQYIVLHQSCKNVIGVAAVQAAHAAGESCFDGPAPGDTHIAVLEAETSADLENLSLRLHVHGVRHILIREPDEPYNGAAIALGTTPTRDRESVRKWMRNFEVFR